MTTKKCPHLKPINDECTRCDSDVARKQEWRKRGINAAMITAGVFALIVILIAALAGWLELNVIT